MNFAQCVEKFTVNRPFFTENGFILWFPYQDSTLYFDRTITTVTIKKTAIGGQT